MNYVKYSVLVLGVMACVSAVSVGQEGRDVDVERRLRGSVREIGVVESARNVEVSSRVSGTTALLFIVPSGSRVEKGDLVAELDDSALRDRLQEKQIQLAQAKASLEAARSELDAASKEGSLTVEIAKSALGLAMIEKEHQLGKHGELATQRIQVETEIAVAEIQLKTLEQRPIKASDNKVDSQFLRSKAQRQLTALLAKKRFLDDSLRKKVTAVADHGIKVAEGKLVAATNSLQTKVAAAKAQVIAAEAELEIAAQRYESFSKQVAACRIMAPVDGVVIHASQGGRAGRSELEEGALVRERQRLLRFPDLANLQMRVRVNESRIAQVKRGQKAKIHLDAMPDQTFTGVVERVSDIAEPTTWFNRDVREYTVIVKFDEPPKLARLGLTGMVEIQSTGAGSR